VLGLELTRRGETSEHLTDLGCARLVRDGLIIALLALCPIRLRNLAELGVGRQLRLIGDTWWIILEPNETKTGHPDERPVPKIVAEAIGRWLGYWRSVFRIRTRITEPGATIAAGDNGGVFVDKRHKLNLCGPQRLCHNLSSSSGHGPR
jgi:hypothetical protein